MKESIVVAHAGRQHSHQLARALYDRGLLREYWTGLPRRRSAALPAAYPEVEVPDAYVRVMPLGTIGHLLERSLRFGSSEAILGQLADYATDWAYARRLQALRPPVAAVIGYENASLDTFRAARKLGIRTILDAASVHHAAGDRWMGNAPHSGWARDVRRHKDAELTLADHILVLSELAHETYVSAGVQPERIRVVPLGYDPNVFRTANEPPSGQAMRFVFVGNAGLRKGFDLLIEAIKTIEREGLATRLAVIGDVGGATHPYVEVLGKLSQPGIAAELARADCLVLPSRCDSFGMVVAEALGSGLPAIVSEHVGAKDLVTESGAGWIVPAADAAALADRMRWCIEHPAEVAEAKGRARAAAGAWTWERYRTRVAEAVLGLLAQEPAAHG